MIDPDAQAFADAYLADPTDDDTLDHHAARMVAGEEKRMTVCVAGERYSWWVDLIRFHQDRSECGAGSCRVCRSLNREIEAASLTYDATVADGHPAPDWRAYQEFVWSNPWIGGGYRLVKDDAP